MARILGISIVLVLAIVIFILYTTIYNAKIAKQLQKGMTKGKQWPAPKNIVLGAVIICLIINFLASNNNGNYNEQVYSVNQFTDYVEYTSEEIKGTVYEQYTVAYETGELAGYEKVEKTENNFHYVYFISEEYDILHPTFILFVEYVGENNNLRYTSESKIQESEGNSWGSGSGGNTSEYYCVIGNMDLGKIDGFNYTLALYDDSVEVEDIKKDNMENTSDNISIWIY